MPPHPLTPVSSCPSEPSKRLAELGGEVPWIEQLSWEPRAQVYHNFLTPQECNHLINLAAPHMKTANVVDKTTGKGGGSFQCPASLVSCLT